MWNPMKVVMWCLFACVACSSVFAQPTERRAWGSFFVAPGGVTNGNTRAFLHLGGGGSALFAGGLGAEVEIGVAGQFDNFGGSSLGIFSPGITYVFNRDKKTTPFLTGGYSLFFRNGTGNGMFVSAGANHWLTDHVGLRFEVRDQILLEGETLHFLEGRFAILLR